MSVNAIITASITKSDNDAKLFLRFLPIELGIPILVESIHYFFLIGFDAFLVQGGMVNEKRMKLRILIEFLQK